MMRQYRRAKAEYPDAVLFFRMGDFYEMFYEDAELAARVLGLTLTSRSKGDSAVPMAGVPHHAADAYIKRLIQAGHKVAICDQVQDPREARGLVERDVTRVVTPGTLTEDSLLDGKSHNYLAALFLDGSRAGLAWVDLSTGAFQAQDTTLQSLPDQLVRVAPAECLVPEDAVGGDEKLVARLRHEMPGMVTCRPDWEFGRDTALRTLLEHFNVTSLEGFGCSDLDLALCAAGAVIHYLQETQKTNLAHIRGLSPFTDQDRLILDRSSQVSLELTRTMRTGQRKGALLWVLDRTLTPMGGRLLKEWITCPLTDLDRIRARHDAVAAFHADRDLRDAVRSHLRRVYDVERLATRVSCARANARDLVALKQSLAALPALKEGLHAHECEAARALAEELDLVEEARVLIGTAIAPEPPVGLRDGGLIRNGYHAELDELLLTQRDGRNWIARFQAQETERTKIPSLKVGYNKVFGYYIEVTHVHATRIPPEYVRKQTLKNAERYITPELKEYETRVLTADERARDLEYKLFVEVRDQVAAYTPRLQQTAHAIARLDVLAALAEVAVEHHYVRPEVTDGVELRIRDGRHPVLEQTLDEKFVPNDTHFDGDKVQMMILTGPNMAGKSTYIRQVALIVLMAQMGGFVPARAARICVVDRIFTRVGAADELARGQSTFMVEMIEAANILNNASPRSLLVLDEIGRGTSTYDGISIAWAVAEYINQNQKSRTLFATHYHELTELAGRYRGIRNYNVAVREWKDEVVFIRKIVQGGTDKSYGLHVARLAGIPGPVISRARRILSELESASDNDAGRRILGRGKRRRTRPMQMTLFTGMGDVLAQELKSLDITALSPLEALNKLAELKRLLEEKGQ